MRLGNQPVVVGVIDGGGQMGRQRSIESQRRGGGSRDGRGGQTVKLGIGVHSGGGKAGQGWAVSVIMVVSGMGKFLFQR